MTASVEPLALLAFLEAVAGMLTRHRFQNSCACENAPPVRIATRISGFEFTSSQVFAMMSSISGDSALRASGGS